MENEEVTRIFKTVKNPDGTEREKEIAKVTGPGPKEVNLDTTPDPEPEPPPPDQP